MENITENTILIAQNAAMIALRFNELIKTELINDWSILATDIDWCGEDGLTKKFAIWAKEFEEKYFSKTEDYYDCIDSFAKEKLIREFGKTQKITLNLTAETIADIIHLTQGTINLSNKVEWAYIVNEILNAGIEKLKEV